MLTVRSCAVMAYGLFCCLLLRRGEVAPEKQFTGTRVSGGFLIYKILAGGNINEKTIDFENNASRWISPCRAWSFKRV
ncbi:hypothetical protein TPHV1_50063 [Treponema phagedenis]|uniref:Uncharacterized protein n=1 Tax=Treponema phagedenis TaxID=162 RepID=A0A0B7GWB5_TREPH|nr:hypothetical protein TPHV1_50063 [Treponema phagedenis]